MCGHRQRVPAIHGLSCSSSDSLAKQISVHRAQAATQSDVVCNRTLGHPFPPAWTSEFCKRAVLSVTKAAVSGLHYACIVSPRPSFRGRLFGLYIWRLREHVCRGSIHFRVTCHQKTVMVPSKAASCYQQMKSVAGCCAERRQRYPVSVGSVTPYPATHWLLGGKARLFLLPGS